MHIWGADQKRTIAPPAGGGGGGAASMNISCEP